MHTAQTHRNLAQTVCTELALILLKVKERNKKRIVSAYNWLFDIPTHFTTGLAKGQNNRNQKWNHKLQQNHMILIKIEC